MKIFEKKFVFEKKDVSLWRHGAKGYYIPENFDRTPLTR